MDGPGAHRARSGENRPISARALRKRGITLKAHDPETSLLEAAFARGDASLGRVIEKAVDLGCRFDGWSETFDFKKWTEAFAACGIDLAACAGRTYRSDGRTSLGPHQERRDHGISQKGIPARHRSDDHRELSDRMRPTAASGARTAERSSWASLLHLPAENERLHRLPRRRGPLPLPRSRPASG